MAGLSKYFSSILVVSLLVFAPGAGAQEKKPDLGEFLPLQEGNAWTYQVKQFRSDGQIEYRLRTRSVAGDIRLQSGASARRLQDERGRSILISVDEHRLRIHGENTGQDEIRVSPAYTIFDTANAPGKKIASHHQLSEGESLGFETTYLGLEGVQTPAGAFRECLKIRYQTTKASHSTMTTTLYLARGVGIVREIQEVFSLPAEQSMRTEIELLNASIGGRGIGGEAERRVRIAEYFPYHQGDTWTYDWKYGFGNGQSHATERKRWFEGTKFTNAGAAFKLVSSTGEEDYQYYVLDKQGLRIVESGEKGMRAQGIKLYYDPPLWIAREDMPVGRTYRWSQPEQEGKSLLQFSATLEGFDSVETPMGRFQNCLRARVEWESAGSRVKNVYYYARGVGMVAYDYEVISRKDCTVMMTLTGRLKEATIDGLHARSVEEANKLWDRMAANLGAAEDNPQARALFKGASMNRYVWDADLGFGGFKADVLVTIDGGAPVPVRVRCSPALDIEIDAPDAATRAIVHEEMSQFVTHRQPRKPFDKWYGPEKAKFRLGKELPEGQEIFIEGDSMGSNYLISQGTIRQLSRNIGRMDFTIFNRKHQSVEDGRYIATEYGVSYYAAGTKQEVGTEVFVDSYRKQGAYWVPQSRVHTSTMKGKPGRIELQISKLEYLN